MRESLNPTVFIALNLCQYVAIIPACMSSGGQSIRYGPRRDVAHLGSVDRRSTLSSTVDYTKMTFLTRLIEHVCAATFHILTVC